MIPGRKEGKFSLPEGDRGKPQNSRGGAVAGGDLARPSRGPGCGCCWGKGRVMGDRPGAGPVSQCVTLTRGALCDQPGIPPGLGRGIFKRVQCAQEGLAGVFGPTQVILGWLCSGCDRVRSLTLHRKQEGLRLFAPVLWSSESFLKLLQGDKRVNSWAGACSICFLLDPHG